MRKIFFFLVFVSCAFAWWNSNWNYRTPIFIEETTGLGKTNDYVSISLSASNLNTSRCTEELRIIDENENIVKSWILSQVNNSCEIGFPVNIISGKPSTTYYAYYGYALATPPFFEEDLSDLKKVYDADPGWDGVLDTGAQACAYLSILNLSNKTNKIFKTEISRNTGQYPGNEDKMKSKIQASNDLVNWSDQSDFTYFTVNPQTSSKIVNSSYVRAYYCNENGASGWTFSTTNVKIYGKDYSTTSLISLGEEEKLFGANIAIPRINKISEPLKINISNTGIEKIIGVLKIEEQEKSIEINVNETKEIEFCLNISKPAILNLSLNFSFKKDVQPLAFYDEKQKITGKIFLNENETKKQIIKNTSFFFSNNESFSVNISKIRLEKEIEKCFENENELIILKNENSSEIDLGVLNSFSEKNLSCYSNLSEKILVEEKEREQDPLKNSSTQIVYSRIPIIFKNTLFENVSLTWSYAKIPENWTAENSSGDTFIEKNSSEIGYIFLSRPGLIENSAFFDIRQDFEKQEFLKPENIFIQITGQVLIKNPDGIPYNISYNFQALNATLSFNVSIPANNSITIHPSLKIPLNTQVMENSNAVKIMISNNFELNISNISFAYPIGNWETFSLRKCKYNDKNLCTENEENWEQVSFTTENGEIRRRGDHLSDLVYLITYTPKQSTISYSISGGSGGSPAGFVVKSNAEKTENTTQGFEFEIIQPVDEIIEENLVELKVKANEEAVCKARIDNESFVSMFNNQEISSHVFTSISEGKHEITVECVHGNISKKKTISFFVNESIETGEWEEYVEREINEQGNESMSEIGITGAVIEGDFSIPAVFTMITLTICFIFKKRKAISNRIFHVKEQKRMEN